MQMREQHRLVKEAKNKTESWQYRLILAIPKNLVYVFGCVVILAFLGMLYVVYYDTDLTSFLAPTEVYEEIVVHPLFQHLQSHYEHKSEVAAKSMSEFNEKYFYEEHLSKSVPLIITDGCENWKAKEKWTDYDYLENLFGFQSMDVLRLDRGVPEKGEPRDEFVYQNVHGKRSTFGYFRNVTAVKSPNERYLYYIHNEIIANPLFYPDMERPFYFSKTVPNRFMGITIWKNFSRKAEYEYKETQICVLSGKEQFRLISPIFKHNIYSGVFEELLPDETPLNFFSVNTTQYPLWKDVKYYDVTLTEGQCLFIPAFFWMQSQTVGDQYSMLITHEYENHSKLTEMFLKGIEKGLLEEN